MLSVRDWIYALGLLVPLTFYNIFVKLQHVDQVGVAGWWDRVALVRSNVLFSLAFGLCSIGLLAIARRGPQRWVGLVFLHVAALCYVIIVVAAHQYFEVTGASLDYDLVALALGDFAELRPILASEVSLGAFAVVCGYVLFGPALLVWAADRLHRLPIGEMRDSGWRGVLMLPGSLAVAGLALIPAASPLGISFSRDPMLQVLVTAAQQAGEGEAARGAEVATGPIGARLVARPVREAKNLVLVILESTGAGAVTPYNETMATTPYLNELAESSLLVERAYSTIPHTSKALVSILCGIDPRPIHPISEALPGLIPSTCLAELLGAQGYHTAFFQPASESFQDRRQLVENFGFEDFFPGESMRSRGFERANYFGFEDDIMLEPSRRWLEGHRDAPFFTTYLTVTPHHQYLAPTRYGRVTFTDKETHNLYLNAVRYQDFFLKNLITQYRELGLYDQTVFIIVGDHGEAFGEHHRAKHDDVLYEEVLRVPFLVHRPGGSDEPHRVAGPASLLDILPTGADLLGFEIADANYPGSSILSLPSERELYFSCFRENQCLGRLVGWEKYIYHYDNQPDEVFDLSQDPQETTNLAATGEATEGRRIEVQQWRVSMEELYRQHHREQVELSVFESKPPIAHPLDVVFHGSLALVGYDLPHTDVRRGETFRITYYFRVLEQLPPTWRLVVEARSGEGAGEQEAQTLAPTSLQRLYRLRYWQPGRFVADAHEVTVPEDWSSNAFVIAMGFFNTRRDQMVRVLPRPETGDELVTVARLTVVD